MSRAPGFLTDLVQDLRNRNLLIPAIALIVAIVAVPILLGGGGSGDAPPASAPAELSAPAMRGAEEVQPVVVADVPGLRDYRKRLNGQGRNPFKQQTVNDGTASAGEGSGSGGSGGSGSSASTAVSTSTGSTATSSATGSVPAPPTTGTDGSSGSSSIPGDNGGRPESRLVKFTIDVRVGRAGDTKVLEDVDPLSLLPGKKRPVVQYVNANADGTRAGFVVSPQVTEAKGDGKCDPGRNDCQFLFLEEGNLQKLVYGEKQETYRLELIAINRVLVPFDANAG